MLQFSIESREDCPVCLEDLHNPVITACAHVFGYECIERVIETQHRCPMCRAEPLELNTLVRPAAGIGEAQDSLPPNLDINTSSSKTQALLSILAASHKKPGTKTVIFSQWTSFLDIIQYQLEANGYTFARIDGTMSPGRRDMAMHALDTDPECTIMLASLAVCSVGLNLVAANQVILADSVCLLFFFFFLFFFQVLSPIPIPRIPLVTIIQWWAPAIEDQAVDRVHRLGQTRPTTVWRLIMDGSIEERVGEIQAEKRKLMMAAFREKDGKKKESSRLGDIERLLR